jgi:hypothetical protein
MTSPPFLMALSIESSLNILLLSLGSAFGPLGLLALINTPL